MSHSLPRRLLAGTALICAMAAAQAAPSTVSGNFSFHKDRAQFDLSIAAPGEVRIWTDSWKSGLNFDPLLTLYAADGSLITSFDDNDGSVDPSAGFYDAGLSFTPLAAGNYHLVLSASSNDPLGGKLADGFTYDLTAPIALTDWNQPGYDIDKNDQKGGFWRINFTGLDAVSRVPEPGSLALTLAALLGLAVPRRRNR